MAEIDDTHCHLNVIAFDDDRAEALERAWMAGVRHILVPGTDVETSRSAIALAEQYPDVYAAVGVHPNDAESWDEQTVDNLRDLAKHPRVRAIGEIGLDFYYDRAPRSFQERILRDQLDLAKEVGLPVIIHTRESIPEALRLLSGWVDSLEEATSPLASRPGVMHAFSGDLNQAREAAHMRFFLGVGGPVTFTNAQDRQKLFSELPLAVLITETDSPYLAPHPYRGRRNEPAHTRLVAEKLAEIHQESFDQVADVTSNNAARLFAWGE